MNDELFIIIGAIGENFQVIAVRCDLSNQFVGHNTLPKVLTNPKPWRMRSDDRIVLWTNEFTEDERAFVGEFILTKFGVIPTRHKRWIDFKELQQAHDLTRRQYA